MDKTILTQATIFSGIAILVLFISTHMVTAEDIRVAAFECETKCDIAHSDAGVNALMDPLRRTNRVMKHAMQRTDNAPAHVRYFQMTRKARLLEQP